MNQLDVVSVLYTLEFVEENETLIAYFYLVPRTGRPVVQKQIYRLTRRVSFFYDSYLKQLATFKDFFFTNFEK